jgi:Zn-dependent protease
MQRERGVGLRGPLHFRVLLHPSWLPASALLVAHLSATVFGGYRLVVAILLSVVVVLGLVVSLLWHELAHAFAARVAHAEVATSVLYPFGDVTPATQASTPSAGALVALAGPIASGLLSALCYAGVSTVGRTATALLWTLAAANAAVTIVNLLPAFPFDGGHIVRAFVEWRTGDPYRATRTAARAGELFGALMVVVGVAAFVHYLPTLRGAGGLWAVVIGALVVRMARAARRAAAVASALEGPAGNWATPFAGRLRIDELVPPGSGLFAVADAGRLAGVAPATAAGRIARDAMLRWRPDLSCRVGDPVQSALRRMAMSGMDVIVVLDESGVARGVLSAAGVGDRLRGVS